MTGPVSSFGDLHQPHEAVDQIVDVAKRARLASIAIDGNRLPLQGLHDEIRHDAPVVGVHARPVGVEDARDLDLEFMLAMIIEEQRLGAALAFIIAGARADRIDVPPIVFRLRMDGRDRRKPRSSRPAESGSEVALPGPAY